MNWELEKVDIAGRFMLQAGRLLRFIEIMCLIMPWYFA